jgi:hypothetical protein
MDSLVPNLFEREPDNKTDQWYSVIRDRSDLTEVKKHMCCLWRFFHSSNLHDSHFLSEFPVRLFNRWWEMEVAWFLHQKGWTLKSSSCGPDFICSKNDEDIYVEAVMCEPGDPNSENFPNELISGPHEKDVFKVVDVSLPERERLELLRIRNSIENKVYQYQQHLKKGLIAPNTPYIIALSSAMIPDMVSDSDGIPSIVKAVYPVGQIYMSFKKSSSERTGGGRTYRPQIDKNVGAKVDTNIFLPSDMEDNYSCISGLLYSASSFKRTRYMSEIGKTFLFVHNYIAQNRLNRNSFGEHMEYWLENGQAEGELFANKR